MNKKKIEKLLKQAYAVILRIREIEDADRTYGTYSCFLNYNGGNQACIDRQASDLICQACRRRLDKWL